MVLSLTWNACTAKPQKHTKTESSPLDDKGGNAFRVKNNFHCDEKEIRTQVTLDLKLSINTATPPRPQEKSSSNTPFLQRPLSNEKKHMKAIAISVLREEDRRKKLDNTNLINIKNHYRTSLKS